MLCARSAPAGRSLGARREPGSQEGSKARSGWVDADTHLGSLRPHCAKPRDNRASGLVGGRLPAERGPRAARSTDTQPSICWLKSNRLANLSTSVSTVSTALYGSRWKITRSKLGSMALLPCLFQLVRAHQAFWGMQAKATGTSAEVLTLKYASVLFSWSWKHS